MLNWDELLRAQPAVLTVVGMAKNAGKTVTLNYLLKALHARGQRLGLTSVGRDGERFDALTNLPKPSINVQPGTLVATACQEVSNDRAWERLAKTGIMTPLGEVEILRAKSATSVVVAGPSKNKEVKHIAELLSMLGAGCVLIDGAFDRQSSADPLLSNQVILATGATLSRNLEQLIAITKCRVEQLTLPACEDPDDLDEAKRMTAKVLLRYGSCRQECSLDTSLLTREEWLGLLASGGKVLMIKGAVGDGLGEALRVTEKPPRVVVHDGSKIFISPELWRSLRAKRVVIEVEHPINLVGVSVNPTFPGGKGFDPDELLRAMGESLAPFPVIDTMREIKFQ